MDSKLDLLIGTIVKVLGALELLGTRQIYSTPLFAAVPD